MDNVDLCFAGAAEQARLVREGAVSAVELTSATLDRIESVDPLINSYRVVLAEEALAAAAAIDERDDRDKLPLAGVPVAIKDNTDVADQITTWGSRANRTICDADAPIVADLRAAGAVIIGKVHCSELAVWPFTDSPTIGATRNPWDTSYSPGGSSGGSGAAAAAGLCGVALGSDGLGSIRVPASFTGIFGLKPQRDRVWHDEENWNGLAVNGPLARHVADTAVFMDAVASSGPDGGYAAAAATAPGPLRVAIAWKPVPPFDKISKLGTDQRRAVEETADHLRSLGHTVIEQEIKFPQIAGNSQMVRYVMGVAESLATLDDPHLVTKRTRRIAKYGEFLPDAALRWALSVEPKIAANINKIFDDVDVVLTPGAIDRPLRIGELDGFGAMRTLMSSGGRIPHFGMWNTIGQPAMSVPAGLSELGLPVSVQLAGRADDEVTLLQLATQLEQLRPPSRPNLRP